jgi:carbon-monoxide dehydrogenase small subunit
VQGREVTTVEGLERDGELGNVQATFVSNGAAQCGFCTPGMIVAAEALLSRNPSPTEAEIREALAGNLCRCTGYNKIVDAVLEAAQRR